MSSTTINFNKRDVHQRPECFPSMESSIKRQRLLNDNIQNSLENNVEEMIEENHIENGKLLMLLDIIVGFIFIK